MTRQANRPWTVYHWATYVPDGSQVLVSGEADERHMAALQFVAGKPQLRRCKLLKSLLRPCDHEMPGQWVTYRPTMSPAVIMSEPSQDGTVNCLIFGCPDSVETRVVSLAELSASGQKGWPDSVLQEFLGPQSGIC